MFFIRTIRYRTQKHPASPERKQGVLLSCMLIVTVKQVHSDAGFCARLFVQGGDMPFHRPLGQEQAVGDLLGAAVRRNHLGKYIPFPFGQPVFCDERLPALFVRLLGSRRLLGLHDGVHAGGIHGHSNADRHEQHQGDDNGGQAVASGQQRHRSVGDQGGAHVIHGAAHARPQRRQAHMPGKLHKARCKEDNEKARGQVKDHQSDQERSAQVQYHNGQNRHHHHAVHNKPHILPLADIEDKACGEAAECQQQAGPLPDIRPARMTESHGIVQCAEHAGHQHYQQRQHNARRPFFPGEGNVFRRFRRGARSLRHFDAALAGLSRSDDQQAQSRQEYRKKRRLRNLQVDKVVVCILEQNSQSVGDPRQPCQCIVAVYGDGSQIVDGAAENAQQQKQHHPCCHSRRIGDMLLDNEGTDNRTQRQDKGQRAFIAPPAPAFHGRIQEKADGAGAQRIVLGNDSSPFRHRQRNHIDKQIFRP